MTVWLGSVIVNLDSGGEKSLLGLPLQSHLPRHLLHTQQSLLLQEGCLMSTLLLLFDSGQPGRGGGTQK